MPRRSSRPCARCSARATTSPPRSPTTPRTPRASCRRSAPRRRLRIAVTVDMIATGTDVKPLECVFFMRDVRSAQYFEQMKGRGARTMPAADFQAVTPDADAKTRFVIVDAVGVTEHDFVEPPLNRDKSVSLKKLLDKAAALTLTEDETATLASRLAKLELELTPEERDRARRGRRLAGARHRPRPRRRGRPRRPGQARRTDPSAACRTSSTRRRADRRQPGTAQPHPRTARHPRPHHRRGQQGHPARRPRRRRHQPRAKSIVDSWRAYLDEHRERDHRHPAPRARPGSRGSRSPTSSELADRIARPPYNWTPDIIWNAYGAIDGNQSPTAARPAHADRPGVAAPLYGRRRRRTGPLRRPRQGAVRRLAGPAGAGWRRRFNDTERWWLDRMV